MHNVIHQSRINADGFFRQSDNFSNADDQKAGQCVYRRATTWSLIRTIIPRQQLVNPVDLVICDTAEDICQPDPRIAR